jgi:glucokinase
MPENSPPTREQAAELAARFLAVCPHQPRMLTTTECKQAQQLAEALRTAPDPHDLALGILVDRLLEALFAVSGEVYSREAQLRAAHAELQRANQPASERHEQAELLARFASHATAIPGVLEQALERSRIPEEDLHAAISELLPG